MAETTSRPGHGHDIDPGGPPLPQDLGAGAHRGAGRHHVIDEEETFSPHCSPETKGAGDVGPSCGMVETGLGGGGTDPFDQRREDRNPPPFPQRSGQEEGLVESPFPKAGGVERNGDEEGRRGNLASGIDPLGDKPGKNCGQRTLPPIFESMDPSVHRRRKGNRSVDPPEGGRIGGTPDTYLPPLAERIPLGTTNSAPLPPEFRQRPRTVPAEASCGKKALATPRAEGGEDQIEEGAQWVQARCTLRTSGIGINS